MKKFTFLFLILFFSAFCFSQDVFFTNTNQSLINLNPSFAGSNGGIRIQSDYRNQAYDDRTIYNSFDAYIKPLHGGVALTYLRNNDGGGLYIHDEADLTYAQHFYLLDKKLKIIPSVQVGYFKKRFDANKYYSGYTGYSYPLTSSSKANVDFNSSLLINYRRLYFGASVFHINQPDQGMFGYYPLPYRFSFFTSYNLFLGQKALIHFIFRYERQQLYGYYQLGANALLFKHVILGGGLKYYNTPYANLGFRANYFTLQVSYEKYFNLIGNPFATFQLTASFNLRNKDQRKTITNFETW